MNKIKKTIAVIGATGSQGKGVVNALVNDSSFNVRALTRNPERYSGNAHEAVYADLTDLQSLQDAFKDAYGVFVVTNYWGGADEIGQGKNAVEAAKEAGVHHFVWSTLPDVETISNGEFDVPFFTNKSKVDDAVKNAGFKYTTFVEAPFYFQNLAAWLAPQQQQDGTTGWTLPLDPTKEVVHWSDINDMGKVVAGAFLQPKKAGNGNYLTLATELFSFNDIIIAYKRQGKEYSYSQVPGAMFSTLMEGGKGVTDMFGFCEKYTYMGPGSASRIEFAKEIATGEFVSFDAWLNQNK
ncbi:NmrA/HSCARG family protein [Dyadobacter pollutisoli]|jgi:uncharacterized protein YbjT (DUF2867 family)|uniref:NmrA/HSCARG family protein n=1 Tax=Dyadobacter pollutisoli TaxID=2910158 RepID=A0A9E8N8V1_9BACT|nr:NmrA/HSCARG family protein [Dyadobacter pollutisoli]WAC11468.1 NmrA/HSCARG family protein [Dyadobacter pollutisoli]